MRRQRIETSANDAFVEQLLGIRIGEAQVARGKAFVQGVVDRAGDDGLLPLLERPDAIPTPERGRRPRTLAGADQRLTETRLSQCSSVPRDVGGEQVRQGAGTGDEDEDRAEPGRRS